MLMTKLKRLLDSAGNLSSEKRAMVVKHVGKGIMELNSTRRQFIRLRDGQYKLVSGSLPRRNQYKLGDEANQ